MPQPPTSNATTDSPPSPQTVQRRKEILQAALEVFARDGFHNADVQLIADQAQVGKGTVYRHFGNKQELFLATARDCLEQLHDFVLHDNGPPQQSVEVLQQQGLPTILQNIAISCAKFYQQCPEAIEILVQERAEFRNTIYPTHLAFRSERDGGLTQLFEEARRLKQISGRRIELAQRAFGDLVFGIIMNGVLEGSQDQLVLRMQTAMEIFLRGLAAEAKSGARK